MSATHALNATIYGKLFVWFANLATWKTIYRTVHIVNWYLLTFLFVAGIVKFSSDTLIMCARHYQHTNTLSPWEEKAKFFVLGVQLSSFLIYCVWISTPRRPRVLFDDNDDDDDDDNDEADIFVFNLTWY